MAAAKNNRTIIFFSILAYFVFLLAMFPLNVLYKLAEPKGLPVQVVAVSGTIWQGEVIVKHSLTGQIKANWGLSVWSLLTGTLASHVQVQNNQINSELDLSLNLITQNISIQSMNGFVQAELINALLKRNKVVINGDLEISDVMIDYSLANKYAESASGRAVWMGGLVNYPKGRKQGSATLPMLIAQLSHHNGELNVDLHTQENLSVANAKLKTDGWGSVAVLKRLIDLVGEPWPNKASADTAVFEISEKVF